MSRNVEKERRVNCVGFSKRERSATLFSTKTSNRKERKRHTYRHKPGTGAQISEETKQHIFLEKEGFLAKGIFESKQT